MADNTQLNSMSGGDTYASDDIGGVKFPRVKMIHGADGVNSGDVSAANPFPVSLPTGGLQVTVASGALLVAPSGLSVTTPSGFILNTPSGTWLSGGTGAPISLANPLPIRAPTGFFLGLTASGLPVTDSNPLPISGSLSATVPSGTPVGITASGIKILPDAGAAAAALRVVIATDQVPIPGTQASGARFTVSQPSGTSF